jgi:secondary thiamine-phosphate synthase enzyme
MTLYIETKKKKEIIDITEIINRQIRKEQIRKGLCILFVKHTTAALTTADLDPGTDEDYLAAFDKIIPNLKYNHPHNPAHVPDHILSSVIGPSLTLPVSNGELDLGTWQRVILVELDGPRTREIAISFFNS